MNKRYSNTPFWKWFHLFNLNTVDCNLKTTLKGKMVRCLDGRTKRGYFDGRVKDVFNLLPHYVSIEIILADGRSVSKDGRTILHILE